MGRYVVFMFSFSMNISYLIFSCCNIIFASRWTRMKVQIERDTHETLLGVLQKKDTWHLVTTSSRGNPQAKTSERTKTKQLLDRHECPSARVQRARSNTPRCARPRILASNWRLFNNRPRPGPPPPRVSGVDAMENLISLVNKLQRACTALGDHGEDSALPTLWDSLPTIAVVGGQVISARSRICLVLLFNFPFWFLVLRRDFFFLNRRCLGFGYIYVVWNPSFL